MATRMAMRFGDVAITEAGFGADLGAEKFLDIKCRMTGVRPSAVVVVATARALKYNGGVAKADLNEENLEALKAGMPNLLRHVDNIQNVYGLPCVVAINRFPTDTEAELALIESECQKLGVNVKLSEVWAKGGEGALELADEVMRLIEQPSELKFAYEDGADVADASRPLPPRSTAPTALTLRRPPSASSPSCARMALATFRCASPRRSTALATTPRPWALPRTSASWCVSSRFPPVPTLWSH